MLKAVKLEIVRFLKKNSFPAVSLLLLGFYEYLSCDYLITKQM